MDIWFLGVYKIHLIQNYKHGHRLMVIKVFQCFLQHCIFHVCVALHCICAVICILRKIYEKICTMYQGETRVLCERLVLCDKIFYIVRFPLKFFTKFRCICYFIKFCIIIRNIQFSSTAQHTI